MGGTDLPKPPSLVTSAALAAMIARGATSPGVQHSTVQDGATRYTDANGATRVASGSYTFSKGPNLGRTISAHVTFDANGNPVIIQGQQPDGTHGIGAYDLLGNKVAFFGPQGFTLFDPAAHPRVAMSALVNGDYGLAVYSRANDGTYQEVLPVSLVAATGTTSVTSSTFAYIGPDVTVNIGASGSALVRSSANIATSAGGQTGKGAVVIDSNPAVIHAEIANTTSASGGSQVDMSTTEKVTGLTPGSHLFSFYAAQTSGTSINVGTPSIEVQPL